MIRKTLSCMLLAALVAAPAAATTQTFELTGASQRLALVSGGQDVSYCVSLDDSSGSPRLVSACDFTIEVAWCVVGRTCNRGLTDMHTFGPNASYPVMEASDEYPEVRWGACRGANSLRSQWGSQQFSCD